MTTLCQHSQCQSPEIRIWGLSRPDQLMACLPLSVSAPHYPAEKYVITTHGSSPAAAFWKPPLVPLCNAIANCSTAQRLQPVIQPVDRGNVLITGYWSG